MAVEDTETNLWEVAEDLCKFCGAHVGYGVRLFHLEVCDDCAEKEEDT